MPSNREYQKEAEKIFTKYLRDIDCLISPIDTAVEDFDSIVKQYPVTASVVIPVKDRPEVIGDALKSALHQQTNFPYNVIVVLNQSGEATKNIVADYAKHNSKVVMIENEEPDIKIGGCWNIAINSKHCGAFAIQLDSDDVYSSPNVLSQIVDTFMNEKCGVLIGSYRITDINLNPLSDTIIDHREYTPQNGVNNALRVNGFGAPRCYLTELVRKNQFKNESYGEDYDLCLRLSRQYKLSRIFDVLYLCRRWGKNSDSNLTPERMAQLNYAKDTFRTNEMLARMI
jgi:glycosyltransferase involved in cell wall biosynthesis